MTDREAKIDRIWRRTPKNMKSLVNDTRYILVINNGATSSLAIDRLSDAQIEELLRRMK